MTLSRRMGNMVTTLKSILCVTFGVEALVAILIYISIYDLPGMNLSERHFLSAS